MKKRIETALAELGSAVPLVMVALLAANDHVLKAAFHNGVTGKLSDVAICFLLPLLVSAVLGMATDWNKDRRLWAGAAIGAAVFTLLEMSDLAGAAFVRAMTIVGVGPVVLTRDPTDLWALVTIPLAVAYGRRRLRPLHPRLASAAGAVALVTASLALMATSPPPECDQRSAPVALRAEPGCGPGGVFVVEADEWRANLSITNPQALGLPPLAPGGDPVSHAEGRYRGAACPFTLEKGEWEITVGFCGAGSGATDAGESCSPGFRRCSAFVEGGGLFFGCQDAAGAPICRSRLTVVP